MISSYLPKCAAYSHNSACSVHYNIARTSQCAEAERCCVTCVVCLRTLRVNPIQQHRCAIRGDSHSTGGLTVFGGSHTASPIPSAFSAGTQSHVARRHSAKLALGVLTGRTAVPVGATVLILQGASFRILDQVWTHPTIHARWYWCSPRLYLTIQT